MGDKISRMICYLLVVVVDHIYYIRFKKYGPMLVLVMLPLKKHFFKKKKKKNFIVEKLELVKALPLCEILFVCSCIY